MAKRPNILQLFKQYGLDHEHLMSPEEWFIKFEQNMLEKKEFGEYLKEIGMHRNTSLKTKRTLFIEWYVQKYQNEKPMMQIYHDLSELLFVSQSTIEKSLFVVTTE